MPSIESSENDNSMQENIKQYFPWNVFATFTTFFDISFVDTHQRKKGDIIISC